MTVHPVTLNIPQLIYDRLEKRAAQSRRTVEIEAVETLVASVSEDAALPADVAAELANMASMNDDVLWRIARDSLPAADVIRLEELHWLQQSRPLDSTEQSEEQALLHAYELAMLRRSQAMVLLKERGNDISPLASTG